MFFTGQPERSRAQQFSRGELIADGIQAAVTYLAALYTYYEGQAYEVRRGRAEALVGGLWQAVLRASPQLAEQYGLQPPAVPILARPFTEVQPAPTRFIPSAPPQAVEVVDLPLLD